MAPTTKQKRGAQPIWLAPFDELLEHPSLTTCSADAFRFFIRLLAMLVRTESPDGKLVLGRAALNYCAGREQLRHSLRVASEGAAQGLYALSGAPAQTVIEVFKRPKSQGFAQLPMPPGVSADISLGSSSLSTRSRSKEPKTLKRCSDSANECAGRLAAEIGRVAPNRKLRESDVAAWAVIYDRMLRLDSRKEVGIREQIAWLFGPNQEREFAFQVWSADSHRKKYDDVANAIQRAALSFDPDAQAKARGDAARRVREEREERERAERNRERQQARVPRGTQ